MKIERKRMRWLLSLHREEHTHTHTGRVRWLLSLHREGHIHKGRVRIDFISREVVPPNVPKVLLGGGLSLEWLHPSPRGLN